MKVKVLSLFDGISCGRVALERAGFEVERYVAYEIDEAAIIVSEWNYPDIEHRGSVVGADFTEFAGFDLVIGGFPCTDLSTAKNGREGLAGKSSRLFWEQVRAIEEIKPRYFLVENNYGMPKADEDIITETLGVEPIFINSATVSAQTRKRLYWTNIPSVTVPEDRGIFLRDIVQSKVPDKYYVDHFTDRMRKNVKYDDSKTVALLSSMYKGAQANGMTLVAVALRTRNTPYGRMKKPEAQHTGKANAITTVQSDSMILEAGGTFEVIDGFLLYKGCKFNINLPDGNYAIRRLTPIECERLQTLPDNYTADVSDTQRYRQLGNGWTVDVIAHILRFIHDDIL